MVMMQSRSLLFNTLHNNMAIFLKARDSLAPAKMLAGYLRGRRHAGESVGD